MLFYLEERSPFLREVRLAATPMYSRCCLGQGVFAFRRALFEHDVPACWCGKFRVGFFQVQTFVDHIFPWRCAVPSLGIWLVDSLHIVMRAETASGGDVVHVQFHRGFCVGDLCTGGWIASGLTLAVLSIWHYLAVLRRLDVYGLSFAAVGLLSERL